MANLPEQPVWVDGIYQLETSDPVLAGPDGIDNLQAKQLGNRTAYLKQKVDAIQQEMADQHPLLRKDVAAEAGPLAWLGNAAGTANALTLTLKHAEAALTAYAAGQRFQFKATATNTGAVTARINGLAAMAVKKSGVAGLEDLVGGDIRAGALYDLNFDGTYFQLGGGVGTGKAFERFSFEASVGQSVFNAPHTIGSTIVMRNGREITSYVSDGLKITLTTPCEFGDAVEILAFSSFQSANAYTKAEVDALLAASAGLPVGSMLPYPKGSVPPGFLEVDGSVQSAAVYPDLAAYLGTTFNKGDEPAGYFRLPDSRGEFLRGWDHGRGVDVGRGVGTLQGDDFKSHYHYDPITDETGSSLSNIVAGKVSELGWSGIDLGGMSSSAASEPGENVFKTSSVGGSETRPRNLAVMWCIKAWNAPVNQGNIDIAALAAQVAVAVPKNYRSGFDMAVNAGSQTTTIDVAPGITRGSGSPVELVATMSGVLQASGAWSAGSGGNKLDAGVRQANSWYHLFVLRRVLGGEADLLFSLSRNAPVVPAGYELVRRLGSIRTDASGNILPFINKGRHFIWHTPPLDVAITSSAVSGVYTISVPPGAPVMARLGIFTSGGDSYSSYMSPDTAPILPGFTSYVGGNVVSTGTTGDYGASESQVMTNDAAAARFSTGAVTASSFRVVTYGWEEL